MLPSLSGVLRLALVISVGAGFVAWEGHRTPAYADDDDEEDDGGDDKGDKGGDESEEEEPEDAKEQPVITAGGLFMMRTYPIRENERPLTMTQMITQLRLGVGADISNKTAFESAGVNLEGIHGLQDNFSLIGGFTSAYNVHQFNVYGGFEGALAYDLIDIRLAGRLGRAALATVDAMDPNKFNYASGDIKAALDIGFPFRYVARPEIAIVALQSVMSVDFNATESNKVKPDLNPSIGIVTNPIAPVSLLVQATLQVVDFDFTNNLVVPATIRIQFSPTRQIDIGGEFTLLNIKPKEGQGGAFDNRFLSLFFAARFGK
jgi:hypothetical protein